MLIGFVNPTQATFSCQFEFDITTFFNPAQTVDSGIGGTTRQFNDVVVAFPLTIASPSLSATKTADGANVNSGTNVGFTISVSNNSAGGTATANNVVISDPLPGGAGTNWSISPAFAGPGTCSISGGVSAQVLTCAIGSLAPAITASVHVSSATSSSGTLNNTATITADNNATLTGSATINVTSGLATTSFSNLTPSQSIAAGTPSITVSGTIAAQSSFPPSGELVTVTIFGLTAQASIGGDGFFSTTFPTSTIPTSSAPYTIVYSYAGDANFTSASNSSTTLTVNATGPNTFPLTVNLFGSGEGTVIGTDTTNNNTNVINCSENNGTIGGDSTCSNNVNAGDSITLTANATSPSTFAGWGGACASFGTATQCTISMTQAQNVTANFLPGPQTVTVTFNTGTNVANMATFDCPTNPNPSPSNPCTDPNAHALNLTLPTVITPFSVTVQAIEVPPGQADGDCESGHTVLNDFDCRFVTFFGFGSDGNGGELVPLCNPYANGNCVHYLVYEGTPGTEPPPADYAGGVQWFITYNNDTFVPPSIYTTPPRLYDDPDYAVTPTSPFGTDCTKPMMVDQGTQPTFSCQFEFDITTIFVEGKKVDSGIGGTTRQFNDVVVAFPPANIPQLQATSAPDNATVTAGNPIGFTVTVTNNGSATATNVTVNDPLPSGTGVNWTLSPAVTGCSITGSAPNQILSCTFATVSVGTSIPIHVTSATAGGGTYTNAATISISGQQVLTVATLTVSQLTSAFSGLTPSQSITYGTPTIALGGTISSGAQFPPTGEMVSITINGASVNATIGANGMFSASFPTATIPASATPYTITYSYAGDTSFSSASDSSTTLTVNASNQTISLTGAPASAVYNSTFPITATATSELPVTVVATGGCMLSGTTVTMTSGTTACVLTANQAGNGNYNPAPTVVVTVNATKAASTTTITGNTPNPSTPGQSVTVSFKVTGNGTPTGSVTVTATLSSTTVTCSGTLTSGAGGCTVTLSTAGTWTLSAAYGGDSNFTNSTSANVNQTVAAAGSTLKFTPSSLNFGTLYIGQVQFENLTITNTGSAMVTFTNFTIQSISGDDSNDFFGVSFCPKTLNAGKSCLIIMGFIADSNVTKTHAANLVVTDNASGSPQNGTDDRDGDQSDREIEHEQPELC